jgi:hypothetical protein
MKLAQLKTVALPPNTMRQREIREKQREIPREGQIREKEHLFDFFSGSHRLFFGFYSSSDGDSGAGGSSSEATLASASSSSALITASATN